MEYKGIHEFSDSAIVIESAETAILEYARRAVLGFYSKDRFKRDIDGIIDRTIGRLKSDALKRKAREGLRIYAQRCYAKERRLLALRASLFAVLLIGQRERRREVAPIKRWFEESVSSEYRHSEGFLKLVDRELPEAVYPSAVPLNVYYKEYTKEVESVFRDLVESGAKESYETNVSLRNVAEMTVRYEHQQEMIAKKRKEGKHLVYILAHANCSERCAKYQVGGSLHPSGLYSLDGTSGTTPEGVKYLPLEFATDNERDKYTTKAGKSYQNGCLTGFNCRHKLGDYKPGVKPIPIPTEYIDKRREIEERQREFEREIRHYKRAAIVSENDKQRKAFKLAAKGKEEQYRVFSKKNNVAYYPQRTSLFEKEDTPLTNSEEKRILYINNRDVRKNYHRDLENIPGAIDKSLSLEMQARQAHAMRNEARTKARDMMADLEERARLDIKSPNKTFDELLSKKQEKSKSIEEAYRAIIGSSTKSNKTVDESLHTNRKGK